MSMSKLFATRFGKNAASKNRYQETAFAGLEFEQCEPRNLLSASVGVDLGGFLDQGQKQFILSHLAQQPETAYLQQGASDLELIQVEDGDRLTTAVFQQLMEGLPVHGSYVAVSQTAAGRVVNINDGGVMHLATTDKLTPQLALNSAQQIANQEFSRDDMTSDGTLVWFLAGERAELAWQVDTVVPGANTNGASLDFMTVIDADNGSVLSQVQAPSVIDDAIYHSENAVFPRITINDAIGAAGSRGYAAPFDAVVELSVGCTGILVAENVVISARHCGGGSGTQVRFGDNSNAPVFVATVQSSQLPDGNGSLLDGGDVAILTLTGNVPSNVAEPMRFIDATNDLVGQTAALMGYGYNGLGSTGHGGTSDGWRWGGENIIDRYGVPAGDSGSNIISTDFDDGSAGNNTIGGSSPVPVQFEATTAGGDSGGPVLVQSGSEWLIAGVLSGGTTNTSVYGDISWWTGTAIYKADIEAAGGEFSGGEAGVVNLDQGSYLIGDTVLITVSDANGVSPLDVTIVSDSGDTEDLTLTNAGNETYTGSIGTGNGGTSSNDGTLQVSDLDQITVTYVDPDDGTGNSNTVDDTATVFEPGNGVIVGVDFDALANPSPANWDTIGGGNNATFSNLLDENGSPTVIDLAIDELQGGSWFDFDVTPIASSIPQHSNDLTNIDGQIYTGADPLRLTFMDLTPGTEYEIYVMAAEGFYSQIQQDVTISGAGSPITFLQSFPSDTLYINDQTGDSARNLAEYAKVVVADAGGEIVIDVTPNGATQDVVLAGVAIKERLVLDLIDPFGAKFLDGLSIGGSLADAQFSDDVYYGLSPAATTNPLKQKIDLILLGEYSGPLNSFEFYLEANMTGGPEGDVIQTIELWNDAISNWELVDSRAATNADSVVSVSATGDLTRFVHPLTDEIVARVQWISPEFGGASFDWTVDVDQFGWQIS